jgi:hypothetical protein
VLYSNQKFNSKFSKQIKTKNNMSMSLPIPVYFFFEYHLDSGTMETLTNTLSKLTHCKHICFEHGCNLSEIIEERKGYVSLINEEAQCRKILSYPHSYGITMLSSHGGQPKQIMEFYAAYHAIETVKLLQKMKENKEMFFYPIDYHPTILQSNPTCIFSTEREQYLVSNIVNVISKASSGVIVFLGITHYKMVHDIKKLFPQIIPISFYISQNTQFPFPIETIDDSGHKGFDTFSKKVIQETMILPTDTIHKVLIDQEGFHLNILKLTSFNEKAVYATVEQLTSPHELLIAAINNHVKKFANDQIILKPIIAKEYGKALRIACNCGRTKLIDLLLDYQSLLHFDVNEKNREGLSAAEYAKKFLEANHSKEENPTWNRLWQITNNNNSPQCT